MKKKLEKLAMEKERIITVCCECRAIKVDSDNWLNESQAHKAGLHKNYLELHTRMNNSHGYCPPCADTVMDALKRLSKPYHPPTYHG